MPNVTNGLPLQVQFAPADVLTGMAMAWGITAALYHRQRTGEGQAINASLLLSALSIQAGFKEIAAFDVEPRTERLAALNEARLRGADIQELFDLRRSFSPELAGNVYYRPYKTRDGYIAVGCLGPGPRARFRKAVGIRDERYEEGFVSTPEALREVGDRLIEECNAIFETRTTADWVSYLDSHGIACGPIRFVEELWEDPQVIANNYIAEYEHSKLGPLRANAPVVTMSATPTRVQRASPALGEHTDELLADLGFDGPAISGLRGEGVIG
jgi:crotonobetainyl-CoA:carnitine CoA-transferase CaiB-like acyl-CoA transferase